MISSTLFNYQRVKPLFLTFSLLIVFSFEASENSYSTLPLDDYTKVQFPGCYENSDIDIDKYSLDKFGTSSSNSTKKENIELRGHLKTLGKNHGKILDLIKKEDHLEVLELVDESIKLIRSSKIFDLDFLTRFKDNERAGMTLQGFNIDGLSAGQYAAAVIPFLGYESAEKAGMDTRSQRELLEISFEHSRWIFLNRGCSSYLKNYLNKKTLKKRVRPRSICRLVNPVEASVSEKLFYMNYAMGDFSNALSVGSLSLTNLTYGKLNKGQNRPSAQISRANILIRLADLSERTQNFCFAYKGYERSVGLAKLLDLKPEIINSWEAGMLRTSNFQGMKEDSWSPMYGNLVQDPSDLYMPIHQVPPVYPRRALQKEIEGCVMMQFTVTKDGSTKDPEVLWSQPPGVFDRAALKSARQYRYSPQIKEGLPIEVPNVKTIAVFKIQSSEKDMYYNPPGCE